MTRLVLAVTCRRPNEAGGTLEPSRHQTRIQSRNRVHSCRRLRGGFAAIPGKGMLSVVNTLQESGQQSAARFVSSCVLTFFLLREDQVILYCVGRGRDRKASEDLSGRKLHQKMRAQ